MSNEKGYRFDETFKAFSEFVWENPKDGILGNAFNMALFYFQRERKEPTKIISFPALMYKARICPKCNSEIELDGFYCRWCGQRIS